MREELLKVLEDPPQSSKRPGQRRYSVCAQSPEIVVHIQNPSARYRALLPDVQHHVQTGKRSRERRGSFTFWVIFSYTLFYSIFLFREMVPQSATDVQHGVDVFVMWFRRVFGRVIAPSSRPETLQLCVKHVRGLLHHDIFVVFVK